MVMRYLSAKKGEKLKFTNDFGFLMWWLSRAPSLLPRMLRLPSVTLHQKFVKGPMAEKWEEHKGISSLSECFALLAR